MLINKSIFCAIFSLLCCCVIYYSRCLVVALYPHLCMYMCVSMYVYWCFCTSNTYAHIFAPVWVGWLLSESECLQPLCLWVCVFPAISAFEWDNFVCLCAHTCTYLIYKLMQMRRLREHLKFCQAYLFSFFSNKYTLKSSTKVLIWGIFEIYFIFIIAMGCTYVFVYRRKFNEVAYNLKRISMEPS